MFMCSHQERLTALVESADYHPAAPSCAGVRSFLFSSPDLHFLHCLETLGDSRLGSAIARLQITHFRDIPRSEHRQTKSALVSNRTLQDIVAKLEVDSRDVHIFDKEVGNGFEIFLETYGQIAGEEAADEWISSLFSPLIEGLSGHLRVSRFKRRRIANVSQPAKNHRTNATRKVKTENRQEVKRERRGHKRNTLHIQLPSTLFTYKYVPRSN
ncbi:hypothetical protein MVEN_02237200 [Mycena venus]|uniref:RNase III domain-containing protein n=1 Tax=Mycena venus TaxID=2733690 RepID=A0A8H6X801_9AGAR|nr:hypothetical protein MVEN_02237200 [Mycena venus]